MNNIFKAFNVSSRMEFDNLIESLNLDGKDTNTLFTILNENISYEYLRELILETAVTFGNGSYEKLQKQFEKPAFKRQLKEMPMNDEQYKKLKVGDRVKFDKPCQAPQPEKTDLIIDKTDDNVKTQFHHHGGQARTVCNWNPEHFKQVYSTLDEEKFPETNNDRVAGVYDIKNDEYTFLNNGEWHNLTNDDYKDGKVRFGYQKINGKNVCYITAIDKGYAYKTYKDLKEKINQPIDVYELEILNDDKSMFIKLDSNGNQIFENKNVQHYDSKSIRKIMESNNIDIIMNNINDKITNNTISPEIVSDEIVNYLISKGIDVNSPEFEEKYNELENLVNDKLVSSDIAQLDEETVYDNSWYENEDGKYPKRTKEGVICEDETSSKIKPDVVNKLYDIMTQQFDDLYMANYNEIDGDKLFDTVDDYGNKINGYNPELKDEYIKALKEKWIANNSKELAEAEAYNSEHKPIEVDHDYVLADLDGMIQWCFIIDKMKTGFYRVEPIATEDYENNEVPMWSVNDKNFIRFADEEETKKLDNGELNPYVSKGTSPRKVGTKKLFKESIDTELDLSKILGSMKDVVSTTTSIQLLNKLYSSLEEKSANAKSEEDLNKINEIKSLINERVNEINNIGKEEDDTIKECFDYSVPVSPVFNDVEVNSTLEDMFNNIKPATINIEINYEEKSDEDEEEMAKNNMRALASHIGNDVDCCEENRLEELETVNTLLSMLSDYFNKKLGV